MSDPWGVSIIVVNYNNERFLTAAIDSALSQDHPVCEVIIVDDCSTDNSRVLIPRYGDRIRSVFREANGHQIAALNSAWPLARHPIVIFLDSDDLLFPHAARMVASVWTTATVKAQFPLAKIDAAGHRIGHVSPTYPPNVNTAMLRAQLLRAGQSHSSPGSGNAYSRSLLDHVSRDGGFELEDLSNYWMDNLLECNAPFYGEVVTIFEPLACYRKHDRNLFMPNTIDQARFEKMADTFIRKLDYLALRCQFWGFEFNVAAARERSLHLCECQLVAAKVAPVGAPHKPISVTLRRGLRAVFSTPGPLLPRIVLLAWFVSVAIAPRTLARRLIALRFIATSRRPSFETLLTTVMRLGTSRKSPKRGPSSSEPQG
jgi:hypothetical protein